MPKKSRRRRGEKAAKQQNKDEAFVPLEQLVRDLSLEGDCDHGLTKLNIRPEIRYFFKEFQNECVESSYTDANFTCESVTNLVRFIIFVQDHCEWGILSRLELGMDDVQTMMGVLISVGYNCFVKSGYTYNSYSETARSLAMLHHVFSKYSGDDGCSFQSYFQVLEFDLTGDVALAILGDEEVVSSLLGERDPKFIIRYFASKSSCSCIPKEHACDHGFTYPSGGDQFYLFKKTFEAELFKDELEQTPFKIGQTLFRISTKCHELALANLWEDEEKRIMTIKYLAALGTDLVISDELSVAIVIAICIKYLEETNSLSILWDHERKRDNEQKFRYLAAQSKMLRFYSDMIGDPDRKTAKFFASRNRCSCLEEECQRLKSDPKRSKCYCCNVSKDRAQLKTCQQCESVEYCSKSCQRADWPKHKPVCKDIVHVRQVIFDVTHALRRD